MEKIGPYIVVFILAFIFLFLVISSIPRRPSKKRFDWMEWMEDGQDDEPQNRRAPKRKEEPESEHDFWKVR